MHARLTPARTRHPRYLPVLQLVTLATLPATALYAIGGLLASPLVIPALILKNLATLVRRGGGCPSCCVLCTCIRDRLA
jgi:hypothetical protein